MLLTRRPPTARQPPAPLQLSWTGTDALAWQPGGFSSRWNPLATELAALTGLYPSGGYLTTAVLHTPDGPATVQGYRLPAEALLQLPVPDDVAADASASLRWFCTLAAATFELLATGRVNPVLTVAGRVARSAWRPVLDPPAAAMVAALEAWRPPVVAPAAPAGDASRPDATPALTEQILGHLVAAAAPALLRESGWRPELPGTRDVVSRTARTVVKLLDGRQPLANLHDDADERTATAFAHAFDRVLRRGLGEPVVVARLRLALPADAAEGWPLAIELADRGAPDRRCTVGDVLDETGAALDVAGHERFLPLLAREAARAQAVVDAAVADAAVAGSADSPPGAVADLPLDASLAAPSPVPLAAPEWERGVAALPVEAAARLLEQIDRLAEHDVELLVPAQLAKRTPSVRASASPADTTPSGRLGRGALVAWGVDVDGTPVDDAVVRRALEAGSSLVQVGGRWVRLDTAGARRALAAVDHHRAEHGELSTVELLRLAAELDAEAAAAGTDGWSGGAGRDGDGGERGDGGVALIDRPPPVRAAGWLGALLGGLPDASLDDGVVPDGFTGELRHYQRRGLGWFQFLDQVGLGGCLADSMGLGKTVQLLAHLAGRPGPHLVVCPLSVVRNWEREAARFTPMLRTLVHHGAGRGRAERLANAIASADVVITTYHLLVRDLDALAAQRWTTVVFDEAQAIKNPHTKAARAARHLGAGQVLALTGTPVENRLGELWSILDVTTPGLLGNEAQFKRRFAIPIEREHDERALAALRTLTSPFVLRRTKADRSLVPDLPDKVEQVAWATLTREQAAMYQGVVDQLLEDAQRAEGMRRRGLVLASLTRLKQICNHPAHALDDGSALAGRSGKLTRFDELVDDLIEADERALVFTQFRTMGDLLVRHLRERLDLAAPFLHGGVPKARRDAMVDRFQEGAGAPLLVVSLKAGGTGLNLTSASRVVHYDRWWNPAVEDQATDRAWRIGQTRSVFVHKLVCQGTVEERVAALIDDKRALADAVVGATGEQWLSELSTDELRDLVVLDPSAREGAA